jgi:pimeloyl-ACP methyl ester carboxylesterase
MFRSIRNHLTSGRGIAATCALILTIGLGLSVTAPAAASDGQDQQGPKPTIVFVHGGWADSSAWNQEITNLERRGYSVIAPADPLRDLAADSAYLRSVLQTISGPIVLVGHSYGGAVITNAAVGVPNVKALVYIAAFAPDKGESLVQLVTMNPGSQIGPTTLDFRPYPLPGGGTGIDLYIKKSAFHDAFAGDLPLQVTDQMQATQRPFANEAFTSPSGDPAWKTIPSWYMVARQDHAIPPATERFMAARAHATTVEVDSSHVAMISQPEATTRLILAAAGSIH